MEKYTTKILKIIEEADDVKTYYLEIPEGVKWEAGAHMHVAIKGFFNGEKINNDLVRHFSIVSLENEKVLSFTTKFNKIITLYKMKLSKLKVGDELEIYTIDNRIKLERDNKRILFLSQGVGIATVRPLIKEFMEDSKNIKEIVSLNINKNKSFIYQSELNAMQNDTFVNYYYDKKEEYYKKLDELILDEKIKNESLYYIVGSDVYIKYVIAYLKGKGISTSNIRIDKKEEGIELFLKAN